MSHFSEDRHGTAELAVSFRRGSIDPKGEGEGGGIFIIIIDHHLIIIKYIIKQQLIVVFIISGIINIFDSKKMITRLRKKEKRRRGEGSRIHSQMSYHTRVSLAKGILHLG